MKKQIRNLTTGDRYLLPLGLVEIIDRDPKNPHRFRALLNGEPTYVVADRREVEILEPVETYCEGRR